MKKLVKRNMENQNRITIEAYGCGDPCSCACYDYGQNSAANAEPGGSGSPSIRK